MKQYLLSLEPLLASFKHKISIIASDSQLLYGEKIDLPEDIRQSSFESLDGRLFYSFYADERLTLACNEFEGARDLLLAVSNIILSSITSKKLDERQNALSRLLLDKLSKEEAEIISRQAGLDYNSERCVIYIQLFKPYSQGLPLPLDKLDILFPLGELGFAIIKNIDKYFFENESLFEYAQAIQGSLLQEEGLSCRIGIGRSVKNAGQLYRSFKQAKSSIEIGSLFSKTQSIFMYERQTEERLLSALPIEKGKKQLESLFTSEVESILDEEMLETLSCFLDNNLSVTEASKQLFIHRNTLLYRLKKFQEQTGLDLKSFRDAHSFRLLLQLKQLYSNIAED